MNRRQDERASEGGQHAAVRSEQGVKTKKTQADLKWFRGAHTEDVQTLELGFQEGRMGTWLKSEAEFTAILRLSVQAKKQ